MHIWPGEMLRWLSIDWQFAFDITRELNIWRLLAGLFDVVVVAPHPETVTIEPTDMDPSGIGWIEWPVKNGINVLHTAKSFSPDVGIYPAKIITFDTIRCGPFIKLFDPAVAIKVYGEDPTAQPAAVSTVFGLIKDPPQRKPPNTRESDIWYGNSLIVAAWPPTETGNNKCNKNIEEVIEIPLFRFYLTQLLVPGKWRQVMPQWDPSWCWQIIKPRLLTEELTSTSSGLFHNELQNILSQLFIPFQMRIKSLN